MSGIGSIIGGIGSSLLGGIAGGANPRPPSLDPTQRGILDKLLPGLMKGANAPLSINPQEQQLDYSNIAQSLTGANNGMTHALTSRGLGRSGLLGAGLMQNESAAVGARNQADLGNLNRSFQQKNIDLSSLLQGLGISNIPGQSGFGGFMNGMAPVLAGSMQNYQNNQQLSSLFGNNPSPAAGGGGGGGSSGGSGGMGGWG